MLCFFIPVCNNFNSYIFIPSRISYSFKWERLLPRWFSFLPLVTFPLLLHTNLFINDLICSEQLALLLNNRLNVFRAVLKKGQTFAITLTPFIHVWIIIISFIVEFFTYFWEILLISVDSVYVKTLEINLKGLHRRKFYEYWLCNYTTYIVARYVWNLLPFKVWH